MTRGPMTRIWMIRAEGGRMLDQFRARGAVSVGWGEAGDLTAAPSAAAIETALRAHRPANEAKQGASVLWRFVHDIAPGDTVVTYDPEARLYHVGTIRGPARFEAAAPLAVGAGEDRIVHPYLRDTDWTHTVHRDTLGQALRNTLGNISTLFRIRDGGAELLRPGAAPAAPPPPTSAAEAQAEAQADTLADLDARARAAVEDVVSALDDRQMELLVAGLLRAMGYRTRVSPRGADRGVDILASPDGFGFQEPRIWVEVKHRRSQTDSQMIRAFLGALRRPGDRGLFVSTGGFSTDARYEAERAPVPVMLMTLPLLVDELLARYETLDPETRALVPLRRLYWPAR